MAFIAWCVFHRRQFGDQILAPVRFFDDLPAIGLPFRLSGVDLLGRALHILALEAQRAVQHIDRHPVLVELISPFMWTIAASSV